MAAGALRREDVVLRLLLGRNLRAVEDLGLADAEHLQLGVSYRGCEQRRYGDNRYDGGETW
ncbi:MAG: hypothetical protein EXR73_08415 [Myxococcales bacterium]|nr:hypothetical protein [Myxococcales bacterium]